MIRRFPNFLCIGAQKCGTTWLYENLRRHPQIWLPPLKEIHYFNELYIPRHREWIRTQRQDALTEFLQCFDVASNASLDTLAQLVHIAGSSLDDGWYLEIFGHARTVPVCGEISPGYANIPEHGIAHVRRLCPDSTVLLFVRDPVDRALSHARHILTFSSWDMDEIDKVLNSDDLWEWCDYASTIDRWKKFYSDNLLVFSYDTIASDPEGLLKSVASRLAVDPEFSFPDARRVVFESNKVKLPDHLYEAIRQRVREPLLAFADAMPEIAGCWLEKHY